MPIHKIILGGEQYLGFALNKLRRLALLAEGIGGYASQHFELGDASISLRIANEQQFLRIEGSRPRYEFFTSDHAGYDGYEELKLRYPGTPAKWIHEWFLGSPGNQVEITDDPGTPGEFLGPINGSFTYASFVGGSARPVPALSLSLDPPSDPAKKAWVKVAQEDKVLWDLTSGLPPRTRVSGRWQTEGIFEYESWPGNSGNSMVQSTRAIAVGRGSTCNWSSAGATSYVVYTDGSFERPVSYDPAYMTDAGYDIMPAYITTGQFIAKGPRYAELGRWWRRASVARSDKGNLFFVCTDNVGKVQVYRVRGAYERANTLPKKYQRFIGDGEYKDFTPPYPSWVTVPTAPENIAAAGAPPKWRQAFWLWAFSADGSRMAACPFSSAPGDFYQRRDVPMGPDKTADAASYALLPEYLQDSMTQTREDTPGVVEFGIKITESGEGDMDFDVSFDLLYEDYFGDSGNYPLEVEYALPGVLGVDAGTLLVSGIEYKYLPGNYFASGEGDPSLPGLDPVNYPDYNPAIYKHNTRFGRSDFVVDSVINSARTRLKEFRLAENFSFRIVDFYSIPEGGSVTDFMPGLRRAPRQFVTPTKFSFRALDDMSFITTVTAHNDSPFWYGDDSYRDDMYERVKRVSGRITGCDLRSMSFMYQVFDDFTSSATWRLFAFGRVEKEFSAPYDPRDIDPTLGAGSREANTLLPKAAALKLYRFLHRSALETSLLSTGFSVHPRGHWAYCEQVGASGTFDIVQPKGGKRTSHKALYNEAFGQSRDYSYYSEIYPGCILNSSKDGVAEGTDYGTFRSYGYWTTF